MKALELLSPRALWLLGLLLPLILLYILKVQRKRLQVGSTWLWQQARRDLMARSPFKRLVVQLPLILQALVLALLALAAAQPASRGGPITGDHLAIVIDTSASMASRDGETTRMELAKAAARNLISNLPPGSDAMILDAGRDTRVAAPPDRDRRRLDRAIDGLSARHEEGDLAGAIALAVNRLKQSEGVRRIVVVSDGNWAHPAPLSGGAIPIEVIRVGERINNTAIVRVDVRSGRDPITKQPQIQGFLLLANYGSKARELYVTMRQQNASDVLASRRLVVGAGETVPVVLTFAATSGDQGSGLIFDVSPHDALPVDDVAFARVPAGRRLPVVLASAGAPSAWLTRALVSDADAEVRQLPLSELHSAKIEYDTFVVVDGACPASPPGGELLIVNPPAGDCFGTIVAEEVERPLITSWESNDPRLRFLTLDGVFVGTGRLLQVESKRQALIRSDKGVLASDISTVARGATLLGFDVGESNWPLKASFVLFARNLLEQARGHRARGISGPALAGQPLRISVPPAVASVDVAGPNDLKANIEAREGLAILPNVEDVGLYRVSWKEPQPGSQWIPVNLVSSLESDLRRQPVDVSDPTLSVIESREAPEGRQAWSWLLALLALAFVTFDVWYFTRPTRARKRQQRRESGGRA